MGLRKGLASVDLVRIFLGYAIEYTAKIWGTTAALNVFIADGETIGSKILDALNSVPDLTRTYRQIRYVADHAPEINASLEYLRTHAPTPEALQAAIDSSYKTLQNLNTALARFQQAKDNILSWSWQPRETAQLLREGWASLPDLGSLRALAVSSEHAAEVLRRFRQLDLNPLYQILTNAIDNFASDEIAATILVAFSSLAGAWVAGVLIGRFWARRGRPGFLVRAIHRLGVRSFPEWYEGNLEKALGPELYKIAEKHFADERAEGRSEPRTQRSPVE